MRGRVFDSGFKFQFMRLSVLFFLALLHTLPAAFSQRSKTCFEEQLSDGDKLVKAGRFDEAIQQYEAGKSCGDKPAKGKSVLNARIQQARKKADDSAWTTALGVNTPAAFQQYLDKFSRGAQATEARQRLLDFSPRMVDVPGGSFQMGSTDAANEGPAHPVTVPDFAIGQYEVTVGEYLRFCDDTHSHYPEWLQPGGEFNVENGSDDYYKKQGYSRAATRLPVSGVSWGDAVAYCHWLSQKTGLAYRLPTEAEWEFAARGGNSSRGFKYAGSNDIGLVAWYAANSDTMPQPTGGKQPNELGLFDMSGNVQEWVQDDWHEHYVGAPNDGSAWTTDADDARHVLRDGPCDFDALYMRTSSRGWNYPRVPLTAPRFSEIGFRIAR